jgi:hypothetical protein
MALAVACRLPSRPCERVLDRVIAARTERRRQGIGGEKRADLSLDRSSRRGRTATRVARKRMRTHGNQRGP